MSSKWGGSHARMLSVPPRLGVVAPAGVWAVERVGSVAAARPAAPAASRARRDSRGRGSLHVEPSDAERVGIRVRRP
jgi:hypothetical protein